MTGGSGRTSKGPFASWDAATSSWRTCPASPTGAWEPFSARFPTSGSMRSGALSARPRLAPPTGATGGSASPGALLKTPTAQLAINGGSQHPDKRKAGGHGPTLADEVEHLLPTPRATDTGTPGRRASEGYRPPLSQVVLPLLPTPAASNPNDGEDLESWEARRQRNLAKGVNGNGQGTPLSIAVRKLSTGGPTDPPSPDGSGS